MSDSPALCESASAVAALGVCQADIDLLDDASLQAGMRLVREHEQELQKYKLWLATTIARRSDHTLGYAGLARKNGFPTPATFIQSMTGTSLDEATKLARLGELAVEAETTPDAGPDGTGGSPGTALTIAATSGGISVDAADAIRRGLGKPDAAVTAEQLRSAAEKLIAHAQAAGVIGLVTPEALLKRARQARAELDAEAIERGEKHRAATRYVRTWSRDGMSGGSWALPDEDGGAELHTALKLLLAKTQGGPRFADPVHTAETDLSAAAVEDERSSEQIVADGFAQIVHNGLTADPTVVPGCGRAPVRVIVRQETLDTGAGSAVLEATHAPISRGKLTEFLCEGGTVPVTLHRDGTIDVGREQRLFTRRQRTALGVRDGGCRFPGCNKPPSWCEAHHINYWAKDHGQTDLRNGILLCRYHHMLTHNNNWTITRDDHGEFWVTPPPERDPSQTPLPMPSKNPLMAKLDRVPDA